MTSSVHDVSRRLPSRDALRSMCEKPRRSCSSHRDYQRPMGHMKVEFSLSLVCEFVSLFALRLRLLLPALV